jgi:hypothetical protein
MVTKSSPKMAYELRHNLVYCSCNYPDRIFTSCKKVLTIILVSQNQIDCQENHHSFDDCYNNHRNRPHHILFSRNDISGNVHLHIYFEHLLFCLFHLCLTIHLYTADNSQFQRLLQQLHLI